MRLTVNCQPGAASAGGSFSNPVCTPVRPSGELAASVKQILRRLHAPSAGVCIGYLRFAQTETGLVRNGVLVLGEGREDTQSGECWESGLTPSICLPAALDDMVQAGILPSERRGTLVSCMSAVHGLAVLVIDGLSVVRSQGAAEHRSACRRDGFEKVVMFCGVRSFPPL